MAFGRLERTNRPQPMGEINMTPLIDVMLVLLVIFMLTAPLMSSSLKLDLPATDAATPSEAPKFLAVSIAPAGELYLAGEKITTEALSDRIAATAKQSPETEVQLRADKRTPYGQVAALIGRVQKAGLTRIAFIADPAAADPAAAATPPSPAASH